MCVIYIVGKMLLLLNENRQFGRSQISYTCQQRNFRDWKVFWSLDRVTPDGCLKREGREGENVSHNFIDSDIKAILSYFRGAAMQHQTLQCSEQKAECWYRMLTLDQSTETDSCIHLALILCPKEQKINNNW
jgi:hypothetical protein